MVRLDRTTGFPKLVLTGLFGPVVRSSRTMTKKRGRIRRSPRYLSAHGAEPADNGYNAGTSLSRPVAPPPRYNRPAATPGCNASRPSRSSSAGTPSTTANKSRASGPVNPCAITPSTAETNGAAEPATSHT